MLRTPLTPQVTIAPAETGSPHDGSSEEKVNVGQHAPTLLFGSQQAGTQPLALTALGSLR